MAVGVGTSVAVQRVQNPRTIDWSTSSEADGARSVAEDSGNCNERTSVVNVQRIFMTRMN